MSRETKTLTKPTKAKATRAKASTPTTRVKALRSKLEKAKLNAMTKVAEAKAELAINLEIAKLERDSSPEAIVKQVANEKLDSIIEELGLISDLKVQNSFGYGYQTNKVIRIARTIKYAKGPSNGTEFLDSPRGKVSLLIKADEETVDKIDLFAGNPAYFSEKSLNFVPAVLPDIAELKASVRDFGLDLGIDIDTSTLLESEISSMFDRQYKRAKDLEKNTIEFAEESAVQYED